MKITIEMLQASYHNAVEMNKLRDANVLSDMQSSLKKYKSLTHRQERYALALIEENSDEAVLNKRRLDTEWIKELESNELREKLRVISKYYLKAGYHMRTATAVLGYLNGDTTPVPDRVKTLRMLRNQYAEKVWLSHTKPPKWKVGDMVTIRLSSKGELPYVEGIARTPYHAENSNLPCIYDLSYMIVAVDSKPIDKAYTYSETAGGTRYYRIIPVGLAVQFDIMECNLKKLLKRQVT